jgi:hypothetical protein
MGSGDYVLVVWKSWRLVQKRRNHLSCDRQSGLLLNAERLALNAERHQHHLTNFSPSLDIFLVFHDFRLSKSLAVD